MIESFHSLIMSRYIIGDLLSGHSVLTQLQVAITGEHPEDNLAGTIP